MEQPVPKKVLSLKELAARQIVAAYPENRSQIINIDVPQDCKTAIARQLLLAQEYLEISPVDEDQENLFVLKEQQISEETYYKQAPYQKPTKHPENPFIGRKQMEGKFRFPYEYTRTKGRNVLQYLVDNVKNDQFAMRGFQNRNNHRLCAGPNKNSMFIYADSHVAHVCELESNRHVAHIEDISVWDVICHKTDTQEEDPITSLEACTYENAFWAGTQSGQLYVYEHTLMEKLFDRYEWLPLNLCIPGKDPIDDIHLSPCGLFLWILKGNKLLSYNRMTNECLPIFELRNIPSLALEGQEKESMNVFVISPDAKYALIGGTRGTILIADLATNKSYLFEEESGSGIYQLWWTNQNVERPVVALKNDGTMIALKLAIAKAEQLFS